MKRYLPALLWCCLFSLNLSAQNGSNGSNKDKVPEVGKIKWSLNPFEHALFVENTGQFDTVIPGEHIYFEAKLGPVNAFFTAKGILYRHIETDPLDFSYGKDPDQDGPPKRRFYYLTSTWESANSNVSVDASLDDKLSYYYTYPKGTHDTYYANVYKKITYHNLYPGIDVVYSFNAKSQLEYTLVVHPGADLNLVHQHYEASKGMHIDAGGNVVVNNDIGTLTDSKPVSYYQDDHQPSAISYELSANDESFISHNLDASKTLIIDPTISWSINPNFVSTSGNDYAYDLDWDNPGNIYVYGGGPSPLQLIKLNAAGAIQWVFNATTMTSSTDYYGDFAVDKHSLECYTVEGWNAGGGARVEKISPTGGLLATDPGNSGFNEMWRIESSLCPAGFVIFGNGTCCPQQACMLDTTMATITGVNILGATVTGGYHDMALTAVDPFGTFAWTGTTQSLLYTNVFNNYLVKSPMPALAPATYLVPDGYAFHEIGSIFYSVTTTFNAMNGLVSGRNWLYGYNGDTLKQINKATGAINAVVQVSTTPYTWGGVDVDLCDNIYVGNNTTIQVYNPSLALTSTLPAMSNTIYDLAVAPYTTQLVYACGREFVASISLGPPLPVPITITKGPAGCSSCNGTATATVNLCGNPDTVNVSYLWSDGQTTRTATSLCAGVDTVTITVECGLVYKDTVTIVNGGGGSLTLTTTHVNATCASLGSATVSVSGGSSPYTYSWSPSGGSNSSASGLSAGTYTIIVTDHNGCTSSTTVVITGSGSITVLATNTNENCNGGNNATATATASGGTSPYTYSWSPTGGTNSTASGLTAGTYTVSVKDANGCVGSAIVTITQPLPLTLTTTQINATCASPGSGTATVSGGISPYTYSWAPSGGSNSTASGLSAGTYTVFITDANGCTNSTSLTITSSGALTVTTTNTNENCNGGNNATATTTASGGTSPYTYSWSPTGGTNSTASGLTAGTYTVSVKDANGCVGSAIVTITQPLPLTLTTTQVTATCASPGSGTATVSGGTSPYTYSWAPSGGSNSTASGLSAGTYTVFITDANGCTNSTTLTITSSGALTVSATNTNENCNGGNNATATATASGGTSPYTYSWSPTGGSNSVASGLTVGTYTLIVTDANGCTGTSIFTITQPNAISATTTTTQATCGNNNGSATVNANGGTSPYTYSWAPSGGSNALASGLSVGTYTVYITDANGCTFTISAIVTQPTSLSASITSSVNVLCFGGTNGSATVSASGGTTPYTYNWSPNGGTNSTGTGLNAGLYTVTVKDSAGCTTTDTITISQPPLLTVSVSSIVNVLCNGGTNGSANATVSGGTSPYIYSWSPIGGSNATGTGLSAGTYTITITDANGCIATSSVVISQPTLLTVSIGATTNVLCNGGTNGSATSSASGGTSPYTYLWSLIGGTNATGTGFSAGTYTVTITDSAGCTATSSIIITQPTAISATTTSTQATCGNNNGSATVNANGGTSPYTYSWAPSGGSNALASGLSVGTYTVYITDANGCTFTISAIVTQPTSLSASITSSVNVLCFGGTNGSATVSVSGGITPYTYNWSPNGGTNSTGTGLSAGLYTVTVKDSAGCTTTDTITISQPPLLTVSVSSIVNVLCNGGTNGSASATISGGTSPYIYSWSPSGGSNSTGTGLSAGTYTITITDANGCIATSSVVISQPTLLTASIGATTNVLCNGGTNGSATANASGGTSPYTYSWSPIGGTNATGTGFSAGTYTITITDSAGCTATSSITITQPTAISATTTTTQATCGNNNGSATVSASGGTSPYTYSWAPSGGSNALASGLSVGTYTVYITDANGCSFTVSAIVTQPTSLSATITSSVNVLCFGGTNGSATVSASGGSSPYTYSWSPSGGSNSTATGLSAGNYTVTTTDSAGCILPNTITITQPTLLNVSVSTIVNVLCNGGATGSASAAVNGGTSPYIYSWSPIGGSNATGTGFSAGTYTITITDANGCTATSSVVITQPVSPLTAATSVVNVTCNGSNNGSASVSAGGGTSPYTYLWSNGAQTQSISSLSTGTYTIVVTDANGCTASSTAVITEPPVLTVSISSTNVTCIGSANGSATATPSGGTSPYTYSWSPGGGTGATISNLGAGSYTITVTDANNCSATAKITITQPASQLAVAASGPVKVCSGAPAKLTSLVVGGTSPYTYSWAPSGATTDTTTVEPVSNTTYTLYVTDANGCTASATVKIDVDPPLSITISGKTSYCPGGSTTLIATPSGGDGIYTFLWLPGGNTNSTITVSPTVNTTYTVELTDACGSTMATATVTISIDPYPIVNFAAEPSIGCYPLCIQFRNLSSISSGSMDAWDWSFGNGAASSQEDPIYCYQDTGTFSVKLTVTSDSGCSSTLSLLDIVKVYPHPVANFTYSPIPVTILDPIVQFTNQSTGTYPITQWYWRFIDGSPEFSGDKDPSHLYNDTGTYCVELTIVDNHGCIDSVTKCIVVDPMFTFYIPDAFTPNGDGINDVFQPKGTYIGDYKMYIFDRWGMKLYYTDDFYTGWNGEINNVGQLCQEDTYVYMIYVTDSQGNKHTYTGRVNLIR